MSHLTNKELFMAQMINRGAELIRINAAKNVWSIRRTAAVSGGTVIRLRLRSVSSKI